MAERYEVVLKRSRACLQSMWDINAKISYALRGADYKSLIDALTEREKAIQELQLLKKESEFLFEEDGVLNGDSGEKCVILREIHSLANSLISQGEYYIRTIQNEMDEVKGKLADIGKGKKLTNSYCRTGNKVRSATFTG